MNQGRHYIRRILAAPAWLYLLAVIAVGIILRTGGERWWWATVMLFAPRWVWAIPLVALVPMASVVALWGWWRRRRKEGSGFRVQGSAGADNPSSFIAHRSSQLSHPSSAIVPVVLAAVWVAWPLMGLCISARGVLGLFAESPKSKVQSPKSQEGSGSYTQRVPGVQGSGEDTGQSPDPQPPTPNSQFPLTIRVLTCNVGLEGYDEAALARLVEETQPDVVTLQEGYAKVEGRRQKAEGTARENDGLGRPSSNHRSSLIFHPSSWHVSESPGIFLASRFPIVSQQALERKTDYGGTRTVGVAYQLDTGEGSISFVAMHLYTPRKGLMATPTRPWEGNEELEENTAWRAEESADTARWVKGLPGPVIVAGDMNLTPDSEVFRRDWSRYTDAFTAAGFGYGYTYGYRASKPLWGIRIDHILADASWRVERCWVGPHIHSDHRPVLAELVASR